MSATGRNLTDGLVIACLLIGATLTVSAHHKPGHGGSTVSVTWLNPSDGETVSGTVPLEIDASTTKSNIETVEWRVDAESYREATYDSSSGTWKASLDSTAYSDGSHDLTARATNKRGDSSTSTISVNVENNQAPSVTWVKPQDGDTVENEVRVRIDASDSDGSVSEVTWQVDGGQQRTASYNNDTGYYEATWNTDEETVGDHSLTATVTDDDGATSTSTIGVTVDSNDEPVLNWVNPIRGETVSGNVTVQINATDFDGSVSDVEWQVDSGSWRQASYDSGTGFYVDTWYTSLYENGYHNLTARATDDDGATSYEEILVEVQN